MKTRIKDLNGRDVEHVCAIIKAHPEVYDNARDVDLLHVRFFGVYDEQEKLVAFYGTCRFDNEIVVCYSWVEPGYRKKGIFTKIINRIKADYARNEIIGIWAMTDNEEANKIYSHMFEFWGYNELVRANYYLIVNRKK